MAKIEKYRIVELPEIKDPFQEFMKSLSGDARATIGKFMMGDDYKYFKTISNLKNGSQIQARMPYDISIH